MRWNKLRQFRDPNIAKIFNLRRAARAGLRVPETVWATAAAINTNLASPPDAIAAPWIVRSASPTEDTASSTAAGQFLTLVVKEPGAFTEAVRQVVDSLPTDGDGNRLGAVFVQPLLDAEYGGVVFFDGFAFESTTAPGGNRELTAGTVRGTVERGGLQRGEAFSDWLRHLSRVFRCELLLGAALDVEFLRSKDTFTVLQARPARFELRRDPLLSLANHREILGDPPSPWIVNALELAGTRALDYFAEVDPEVRGWNDRYAVTVAGRSWLNFSFFFRLMDHWGLPRSFVTEGVGGESSGPLDERIHLLRMLRKAPKLIRLQLKNMWTILRAQRSLAEFEHRVVYSRDLRELFDATVFGLGVALRTNFGINGALTGAVRVRRALGIRGRARVTTEEMMDSYDALRAVSPEETESGLDRWLEAYGHRGPLESDPSRPRFSELRAVLLADLNRANSKAEPRELDCVTPPTGGGLWFALDRKRETFRDDLMRIWQLLRRSILKAAKNEGFERVSDVFLLELSDLEADTRPDLIQRKQEWERLGRIQLPTTAAKSVIEEFLEAAATEEASTGEVNSFRGIGLSRESFVGNVQRANDLVKLLEKEQRLGQALLNPQTVLVVPALEPSWSVVFGRVGAVVTELGGELSHASILLREAGKPAIVNCPGVFGSLADGDRVSLDCERGVVERVFDNQSPSIE